MPELATLEVEDTLARLTLNRPDARNALSIDLLDALHKRVDELLTLDPAPKAVVVSGAGKAFCAGMDLKQVLSDPDAPLQLLSSLADLTLKLRRLPGVVIASVNGAAIGGGCGLATVCDLAVTHADSKMGFPEVDLGVCPAVVTPWLVRKVGAGTARAILLQGGLMSGTDAHRHGIVDALAESREELDQTVRKITDRLATSGSNAIRATKGLLNTLDNSLDPDIAQRAAELSASVLRDPGTKAALAARFGA